MKMNKYKKRDGIVSHLKVLVVMILFLLFTYIVTKIAYSDQQFLYSSDEWFGGDYYEVNLMLYIPCKILQGSAYILFWEIFYKDYMWKNIQRHKMWIFLCIFQYLCFLCCYTVSLVLANFDLFETVVNVPQYIEVMDYIPFLYPIVSVMWYSLKRLIFKRRQK